MTWIRNACAALATLCAVAICAPVHGQPEPPPGDEPPSEEPEKEKPVAEDPVVNACLASFDASQALRRNKKLLDARKELLACSQESCPAVVTVKCQQWLEEVKVSIPSVVISASDDGRDVFDVEVFIDGERRLTSLDGTALELDIGPRKFRAVRQGVVKERTVLIAEGVKNRMVSFDFSPPKPPPPPPVPAPTEPVEPGGPGFSLHWLSWTGFSVGLAGVVAGAITGGLAFEAVDDLEAKCPGSRCGEWLNDPDLAEEQGAPSLGATAALNHASTVSFAVGGLGVALGIIGLFIDDDDESCQITSNGFSVRF
jgi:hypothetical protein